MGLPGYWVVLFGPAAAHDPAGDPWARHCASGSTAFRTDETLGTGTVSDFGAHSAAESFA